MAYRLIAVMGLLSLLGCDSNRLVERPLHGVGVVSVPARAAPVHDGEPYDEDPARLYYRFAHDYGLASWGSSTAYRQILQVSLLAPDAGADDYERWPPRFEPLYSKLATERTLELGAARLTISAGRYAQNALDEPAHVYLYHDPSRRLQIAWHVVDKDIPPKEAVELIPLIAASFQLRTDPTGKFAEMRGRGAREQERAQAAVALARETLNKAGFGAAEPGKPVFARGIYVEWMEEPERRIQLLKPLGLLRLSGQQPPIPQVLEAGITRRGSVGWRMLVDGAPVSDNRDNAYLPLPGIEGTLSGLQADDTTALYYYATTLRVENEENDAIASLGGFFEELPDIESAWREGKLVSGERMSLPKTALPEVTGEGAKEGGRFVFGIDLETGTPLLDSLRRKLAAAAQRSLPDVRAGRFEAAESNVLAIDRDIQAYVMLGAMYTGALENAVRAGERESRPEFVAALHERALHWRLAAYPEPHTAYEADDYEAGRDEDRAQLAALLASIPS